MQTQLKPRVEFAVAEQYKWRDRSGKFHLVDDMETRHLFHVVRMVWDHSMPKECQTSYRRRYTFSEFYTEDYMALTVRLMLPALLARRDITPEMMYWVEFMRECLRYHPPQISFVRKIAYKESQHGMAN